MPHDLLNVVLTKDGQERRWLIRYYPPTQYWFFQASGPAGLRAGGLATREEALEKARALEAEIAAAREELDEPAVSQSASLHRFFCAPGATRPWSASIRQ